MIPLERHRRLAVVGKRRALALGIKLAAVEIKCQLRQHLDLALGFDIADERNAQLQILEFVFALHGFIIEFHPTIAQRNVVERKTHGLGWFLVGLGELGNHIINIELAQRILGQTHHGRIHLNRIQHGSQPEDGLGTGIDKDALDFQLWLSSRLEVFLSFSA